MAVSAVVEIVRVIVSSIILIFVIIFVFVVFVIVVSRRSTFLLVESTTAFLGV